MTAARAPKFAPNPAGRAMIAKLHIARKDLGLSEDDYRAVLLRETGKSSAGDMTLAELDKALAAFVAQGWKPGPSRKGSGSDLKAGRVARAARPADHPSARKARAMWVSLWNLGAVKNPAEAALEAFAARQLGVERMQWADQAKCYKLIEALKAMAERAGWLQGPAVDKLEPTTELLMRRLIGRQCSILIDAGERASPGQIVAGCKANWLGESWCHLPLAAQYRVAAELGERVREVRAG